MVRSKIRIIKKRIKLKKNKRALMISKKKKMKAKYSKKLKSVKPANICMIMKI